MRPPYGDKTTVTMVHSDDLKLFAVLSGDDPTQAAERLRAPDFPVERFNAFVDRFKQVVHRNCYYRCCVHSFYFNTRFVNCFYLKKN